MLTKEERRKARETRRIKQRQENGDRAAKMREARRGWESKSKLPALPVDRPSLPSVNVGCSGWFYWHWRNGFYPADLPTKDWFAHYASHFQTVELNAPFYSWPTTASVRTWVRQAGRRKFVYTVKVSELITHIKRFNGTKRLIRDFCHIADLLGPRMGCFLFQLPPSFKYTRARLDRIAAQLDPARRNVVEFRHSSWWNEEVVTVFRANGIIFCSCSGPKLPDELVKTADEIYIRFHGTKKWYQHNYTPEELNIWIKRIAASGALRVWVYFNNDRNGYAIKNSRRLRRQLRECFPKSRPLPI
jgi:uncharacterized protein YecE (DUF72 family)